MLYYNKTVIIIQVFREKHYYHRGKPMAGKFFSDLKAGVEEVIAYKRGKLDLRSEEIELPESPEKGKALYIERNNHKNQEL